jgi:drug/metabolite transporter (DMT)-like permease
MFKLVALMTLQSTFLVTSQILLKLGLAQVGAWEGRVLKYALRMATNLLCITAILALGLSAVIWLYVLRRYEFSIAYPLVSISYIISLVAARVVFKEQISLMTMAGVTLVIVGVLLIVRGKASGAI